MEMQSGSGQREGLYCTCIQLYVCEHCGTKYKDKNECKKCESNHRAALEIHDMRFHACKDSDNYPDKVELKMADGKMIWYHR